MKKIVVVLILLLSVYWQSNAQYVLVSQTDTVADYTSIQAAIDASDEGTLIFVDKGIYEENIELKKDMFLIGFNYPVIDGGGSGITVKLADNSTLYGFAVQGSGSQRGITDCGISAKDIDSCYIVNNFIIDNGHYGVVLNNATAFLYRNYIVNNDPLGVYITNEVEGEIAFNVIYKHSHSSIDVIDAQWSGNVYNNLIGENELYGIDFAYTNSELLSLKGLSVFNNVFYHSRKAISNTGGKPLQALEYNCFYGNDRNYATNTLEQLSKTNIEADPLYENPDEYNFTLGSESPCFNAGQKGATIGHHSIPGNGTPDRSLNPDFQHTEGKYVIRLQGIATNHTHDDASGNVSAILTSDDGVNFTCEMQYDNVNLFGHAVMTGEKISEPDDDVLRIKFDSGSCDLDYRAGFPIGTEMPHIAVLTIDKNTGSGEYFLEPVIPVHLNKQEGSYEFETVRINRRLKRIIRAEAK